MSLLQEAVLDKIDQFNNQLMAYFESLQTSGRESTLLLRSGGQKSVDDIAETVEEWLANHCVRGAYTVDEQDESNMAVSQAMMPLLNEKGRGVDAYGFYKGLVQLLKSKGIECRARREGLGGVIIEID